MSKLKRPIKIIIYRFVVIHSLCDISFFEYKLGTLIKKKSENVLFHCSGHDVKLTNTETIARYTVRLLHNMLTNTSDDII